MDEAPGRPISDDNPETPGESDPRAPSDGGLSIDETAAPVPPHGTAFRKSRGGVPWRDIVRDEPTAAANRRRRYNAWTRIALVAVGLLMMIAVGTALTFQREGSSPLAQRQCLERWNTATNGQARRIVNQDVTRSVGTPRQRMWLGNVDGACVLAYLRRDGGRRLWRELRRSFGPWTGGQSARLVSLTARAATEANVTITLAAGDDLLVHPQMGVLTSP